MTKRLRGWQMEAEMANPWIKDTEQEGDEGSNPLSQRLLQLWSQAGPLGYAVRLPAQRLGRLGQMWKLWAECRELPQGT